VSKRKNKSPYEVAKGLGYELGKHQLIEAAKGIAGAPFKFQIVRDAVIGIGPGRLRRLLPIASRLHIPFALGLQAAGVSKNREVYDAATDFMERFSEHFAKNLEGVVSPSDSQLLSASESAANKAEFDSALNLQSDQAKQSGDAPARVVNFNAEALKELGDDAQVVTEYVLRAVGLLERQYRVSGDMDARVLANKLMLSDSGVLRVAAQAYYANGESLSYMQLRDRLVGFGLTVNMDDETAGLQFRVMGVFSNAGHRFVEVVSRVVDNSGEVAENVALPYVGAVSQLLTSAFLSWGFVWVLSLLMMIHAGNTGNLMAMFGWRLVGFVSTFVLIVGSLSLVQTHFSLVEAVLDAGSWVASSFGSILGFEDARNHVSLFGARLRRFTRSPIDAIIQIEGALTFLMFLHGGATEVLGLSPRNTVLIWFFVAGGGIALKIMLRGLGDDTLRRAFDLRTFKLTSALLIGVSVLFVFAALEGVSPHELVESIYKFSRGVVHPVFSYGLFGIVIVALFGVLIRSSYVSEMDDEHGAAVGYLLLALVLLGSVSFFGIVDVTSVGASAAGGGQTANVGASVPGGGRAPGGQVAAGGGQTVVGGDEILSYEEIYALIDSIHPR